MRRLPVSLAMLAALIVGTSIHPAMAFWDPSLPEGGTPDAAQNPASADTTEWTALLAGRWRFADGRACSRGYGTATAGNGTIRFEWRLPEGHVNVAIERVDTVSGNAVQTTVVSDVGTPTPEVGNRVQYEFGRDQWVSVNMTTRQRARHVRC